MSSSGSGLSFSHLLQQYRLGRHIFIKVKYFLTAVVSGHLQSFNLCDAKSQNDAAEGPSQAQQESWSRDGNLQKIPTGRLVRSLPTGEKHRPSDLP